MSEWITNELTSDVFKNSAEGIKEYQEVTKWAIAKGYHFNESAINEFCDADEADAWLISLALKRGITIITHEVSDPNCKRKIKIPDVCKHFGVNYMNTIQMFRTIGESF